MAPYYSMTSRLSSSPSVTSRISVASRASHFSRVSTSSFTTTSSVSTSHDDDSALSSLPSKTTEAAASPTAAWGLLGSTLDYTHLWSHLLLALYEYLRATTDSPPRATTRDGNKPYLTPEMVFEWKCLMNIEESFSADEAPDVDIHTLDTLARLEYKLHKADFDLATRSEQDGPELNMPYLTRQGFNRLVTCAILRDPHKMISRLNELLQDPNHAILDPFTGELFPHTIPSPPAATSTTTRTSFASSNNGCSLKGSSSSSAPDTLALDPSTSKLQTQFPHIDKVYSIERAVILAKRKAYVKGERSADVVGPEVFPRR